MARDLRFRFLLNKKHQKTTPAYRSLRALIGKYYKPGCLDVLIIERKYKKRQTNVLRKHGQLAIDYTRGGIVNICHHNNFRKLIHFVDRSYVASVPSLQYLCKWRFILSCINYQVFYPTLLRNYLNSSLILYPCDKQGAIFI